MHLNRLGKTDCLTGQSLNPCSKLQVFPFNLLGVAFVRLVLIRIEMMRVGTVIVRVITLDPKRLQQAFQLQRLSEKFSQPPIV